MGTPCHLSALDPVWDSLVQQARRVRERAYCPYSRFAVGSAVLWGNGRTSIGANVENASFGLTLCAERAALASAVAEGALGFDRLVVVGPEGKPPFPCGACRQWMLELADLAGGDPQVLIGSAGDSPWVLVRVRALLPLGFAGSSLPPVKPDR